MKRVILRLIESRVNFPRLSLRVRKRLSKIIPGGGLDGGIDFESQNWVRGSTTSIKNNQTLYQIRSYNSRRYRFTDLKKSSRSKYRTNGGYDRKGNREYDIIIVILAINGIVYLIFSMMTEAEKRKYRLRYSASLKNLREGKLYCLLTSNFIHADFFHFAINAFVFYSFGRPLSIVVGKKRFIRLLALSSIMSPLSYLSEKYFYFRREPTVAGKTFHFLSSGCGLSGVTMSIVTAACILMPHQSVLLYFVIPMNLRLAWFGIIGYDIYSLVKKKWRSRIASSAHLGGAATSIFLYRKFLSNLILPF